MSNDTASGALMGELLAIMARLRDPDAGCPWDLEQSFRSIVPHTLEEAYEVADAIERDDLDSLRDELGDLLFQVVFYARLAEETGEFGFPEVVAGIIAKLRRRHPHVFGDADIDSAEAQSRAWEEHKRREREARADGDDSALAGVPVALPALTRAAKLQRRAAAVGFDWPRAEPVRAKLIEELEELEHAVDGAAEPAILDEAGDLLFACVNVIRHAGVDPEQALRRANAKFERRFRDVEARLADAGSEPRDAGLAEMDRLWDEVKRAERGDGL